LTLKKLKEKVEGKSLDYKKLRFKKVEGKV